MELESFHRCRFEERRILPSWVLPTGGRSFVIPIQEPSYSHRISSPCANQPKGDAVFALLKDISSPTDLSLKDTSSPTDFSLKDI